MFDSRMAVLERLRSELREREEIALASEAGTASGVDAAPLLDAAKAMATTDPDSLCDDELLEVASQLEQAQRHLDSARCQLHGALDARGVTIERSGHTTRAWLGAEHGLSRVEAGRRVRVAGKVRRHLPLVEQALRDGELTFEHVRVIADLLTPRVQDVLVSLQSQLIDLARGVRFERWVQDVRDLIAIADPDGGHDPSPERNRLKMTDGLNGELFVDATFVGEHAAVMRHSLNTMADQLFQRRKKDEEVAPDDLPMPTRAGLLADACVELARSGMATGHRGKGPAADVSLVIHAGDPTVAHTPDGVRLADGTTRLFMCDPSITALVRDSLGVPLDMGRKVRFGTPEQRRAAMVRDGGCVFPGCDVPSSWVDLHHVHHAEDLGPTDMVNLASLCRAHHGIVHRKGWFMTAAADQWFTVTTPTGKRLHSQRHGRQRGDPSH